MVFVTTLDDLTDSLNLLYDAVAVVVSWSKFVLPVVANRLNDLWLDCAQFWFEIRL